MAGQAPGLWAPCRTRIRVPAGLSPCRTARANNSGIVLTFVLPAEQFHLGKIEEILSGGKSQALISLHWGQASPVIP